MYDFIIRNGLVMDFSTNTIGSEDLYVKGGKIVPKGSHGPDLAVEILDASGKYVVPGLIDAHIHVHYDGSGDAHADIICPSSGVTLAIDGGSTGWRNYPLFDKLNPLRYVTSVKSFLHLSPFGVLDHSPAESHDPEQFDEEVILSLLETYGDNIVGLKVRLDRSTLGGFGLAPLKRGLEIADKANALGRRCVVDAHCANLPESVDVRDILAMLRPGDIFVHAYQNRGQTLFDDRGRILEDAKRARDRGVLFDSSHGRIHWSLDNMRKALADGFPPDIISSDIVRPSVYTRPGFSLLHAMGLWLNVGMDPVEILKAVTWNPARILGLAGEFGVLKAGGRADIAVLDIIDTPVRLFDRFGGEIQPSKAFVPLMTLNKGEMVFRQTYF